MIHPSKRAEALRRLKEAPPEVALRCALVELEDVWKENDRLRNEASWDAENRLAEIEAREANEWEGMGR